MLRYLSLFFFSTSLLSAQLIPIDEDDYTGSIDVPLFPGTTISGGITPSTDEDVFEFEIPYDGTLKSNPAESVTFSLNYTHSSDFLSPKGHLEAEVYTRYYDDFLGPVIVSRGFLSSFFLLGDSSNTISLTVPSSVLIYGDHPPQTILANHFIRVFPSASANPSYTLTVRGRAAKDQFDASSPNETQATATQLIAKNPSHTVFGEGVTSFHQEGDVDWYRFTPEESGPYQARISQAITDGPSSSLFNFEVRNSLGQILSTPITRSSSRPISIALFNATAGETYFIKASPGAAGFSYYLLQIGPHSDEEASPPGFNRFFEPIPHLTSGPIPPEGLSLGDYVMDSRLIDGLGDYDSFRFPGLANGDYLVTIDSENTRSPIDLNRDNTEEDRTFFYLNPVDSEFIDLYATQDNQLGSYSITIRPFNSFDTWWSTQSSRAIDERSLINGLPAGVIYRLNLDPNIHHPDLFQVATNGSIVSIVISLPAEGTRGAVEIQESSNLETWTAVPAENINQESATIPPGTFGNIVITYPADEARRFVRIALPE